jgi:hypothetical protein
MSGGPIVQAATATIVNNATDTLPGVAEGVPVSILIRANSTGLYVGANGTTSSATSYQLNANQEYIFELYPSPQLGAASADYDKSLEWVRSYIDLFIRHNGH